MKQSSDLIDAVPVVEFPVTQIFLKYKRYNFFELWAFVIYIYLYYRVEIIRTENKRHVHLLVPHTRGISSRIFFSSSSSSRARLLCSLHTE